MTWWLWLIWAAVLAGMFWANHVDINATRRRDAEVKRLKRRLDWYDEIVAAWMRELEK